MTIMTATIFFSILFSLFISHLPRPLSESTGSTKEAVGASSSTTNNLDDVKQRLVNSIESLLDIDIKHNSDLHNNKKKQQDNTMSSSDQPTTQTAAQATIQPTMVPLSAGTSSTSILPQLDPITINESNIIRQLNAVTISMKLRDNNLYQTSSTTLLNLYDNFSAARFLANSTPSVANQLERQRARRQAHQRLRQQREAITAELFNVSSAASEWFICLTEEEHQHYQQHQHLQPCLFNHHQQQQPRLHSDSISAINYLIYVGSTATTSETVLPNVPDDSTLYLYSFVLIAIGSSAWTKYHQRAGCIELEPATDSTMVPTSEWGYLNNIIARGSTATLNFLREASFSEQPHHRLQPHQLTTSRTHRQHHQHGSTSEHPTTLAQLASSVSCICLSGIF